MFCGLCWVASPWGELPAAYGLLSAAELPANVSRALEANDRAFDQFQVEYQWYRTTPLPENRISEVLKFTPGRPEFFGHRDVKYIRQGTKIYAFLRELVEVTYGNTTKTEAMERERTFDGEKIYDGTGETARIDDNSMLHIYNATRWADSRPDRRFADSMFFASAGYHLPDTNGAVVDLERPKSQVLYLLNNRLAELVAVGSESVDGEPCVAAEILDGVLIHRFLLSPDKRYAAVRIEQLLQDRKLLSRTENTDFISVGGDDAIWLPRVSTVAHYARLDRMEPVYAEPVYFDHITVQSLSREPVVPGHFVLRYKPGTWITDETFDDNSGSVTYQMPADPDKLDEAIRLAKLGLAAQRRTRGSILWIVAVNAVLLGSLIAIWTWRRYRNRHAIKVDQR